MGGQSKVATPPAPAVRKVAVGVPSVEAPPEAMYRIWPELCESPNRPHAGTGPLVLIDDGDPGTVHYTPKVCCLNSTTAIYCWDLDDYPTTASMVACVVTRSGLSLTTGPITTLDTDAVTDLPSEILRVSDTTALVAYDYNSGSDSDLRLSLLEISGTSVSVVDQYSGFNAETGFTSLSRIPGTSKFLATGDGSWIYVVEVSGTSMTVTPVAKDATFDTKVLALSPSKFIIGYYGSSDWTIRPGTLSGTSITWGSAVTLPDTTVSPSGNTDPLLGRLSDASAVVFYRAWPNTGGDPAEPLEHSCPGVDEEQRAIRLDVADDLSVTFYTPCIIDGWADSFNTAPFSLDDAEEGRILYVYDVVQPDATTFYDAPAVVNIALAEGGTGLYGYGTAAVPSDDGGSFLYWGVDIGLFPGTDVALLAIAQPGDASHAKTHLLAVEVGL